MPCESFAVCVVGISGADFLVFTLGVGWLVGWCDVVWCGVVGLEIRGLERRERKSQESFVCLRRGMFADDLMFSYLSFL